MSTTEMGPSDLWGGQGWIDVSRPLNAETQVWPGDSRLHLFQERDGAMTIGRVETTCHVGTHVDAPLHLDPGGIAVHEIPLSHLIGPAEVVRLPLGCGAARPGDLPLGWEPRFPKVLLRSDSHPLGALIADGFAGASSELIQWLAERGVKTLGIDSPSVDVFSSTDLEAHHALADRAMTWIEGLDLSGVEAGCYVLVALPMPLRGADGAPVRAVLRKLPESQS